MALESIIHNRHLIFQVEIYDLDFSLTRYNT